MTADHLEGESTGRSHSGFSRGESQVVVPLNHRLTQKLVTRRFDRLDHQFFVSTKVLRAQGRKTEAQAIEKQMSAVLQAVSNELAKSMEDIKPIKADAQIHGITPGAIQYDSHADIAVSVSTSFSMRVLVLIKTLDELLSDLDVLELALRVTPEASAEIAGGWRSKFISALSALSQVCKKTKK